jgi:hypothetical protein
MIALGLVFLRAPGLCLVACWALYLSFVSVGGEFLTFQWDNLLLESAFFTLFVTPWRWRGDEAPPPHPVGVFLMQWLLLRLMIESGLAKLATGDPTWRNLTAMATYYETAPLPTWVGWYAHQAPLWVHKATSAATFVVEIGLPLAVWGPRRLRRLAFLGMLAFQTFVILPANYGFFNYLSAALAFWMLDDHDLGVREHAVRVPAFATTFAYTIAALVLVPISCIPFLPFVPGARAVAHLVAPIDRVLDEWRSINAYHLFASMTLVRREPVFEGTADGVTWQPYELRYKPGDLDRPPPFVAPHQPRVDFQLWFLFLGHHGGHYAETLVDRMLHDPRAVASLFSRDPFPDDPPSQVRIAIYRYRFSDRETHARTGEWWTRELEGHTRPIRR